MKSATPNLRPVPVSAGLVTLRHRRAPLLRRSSHYQSLERGISAVTWISYRARCFNLHNQTHQTIVHRMNQGNKQHFNNHHRYHGGSQQNRAFRKQPKRVHITPEPGQVVFRLLCPVFVAGGVIGHSGIVVRNLELETGVRISIEDALAADSGERLIYVVGSEVVNRTLRFQDSRSHIERGVGEEKEDACDVSSAQEGLVRVFERMLEIRAEDSAVEGGGNRGGRGTAVVCRLLAVTDQIGAVLGREGKIIDKIRRGSGACIRVLPDQLPPCADMSDELIQITGDTISVKKALIAVSKCLQKRSPRDKVSAAVPTSSVSSSSPYGSFLNQQTQPSTSYGPSFKSWNEDTAQCGSTWCSLSEGVNSYPNADKPMTVEVVFRMLCSSDVAGAVIGKGGVIVKALQDETGASISFAPSVSGYSERIISISSFETMDLQHSPAQNAVLRVFARSTEALAKNGTVSNWKGIGVAFNANARLVIPSNQSGCLIRGSVVSEVQKLTGTRIEIYEGRQETMCVSRDMKVVQIVGTRASVQSALFEVTRRLRVLMFQSKGLDIAQTKTYASPTASEFMYNEKAPGNSKPIMNISVDNTSSSNETREVELKMNHLQIKQPPKFLPHQNFAGQRNLPTSGDMCDVSSEERCATVTNMMVEMAVREQVFNYIFGKDDSNLARLKEISGARVEIRNPVSGSEGKVIISGTPDQTLAGQSLLRAYILTAKKS